MSTRRTQRRTGRFRALVLWGLALAAGVLVGRFLVPASTLASARAEEAAGSPAPRPSAEPTYATTPPTGRDLLGVGAFRQAGLEVRVYPQNGNTAPEAPATECTDLRTVGARTLADVTRVDPQLLGTWTEPSTTDTAAEKVAVAASPAEAETAARRLVAANATCQHRPVGQWVYGPQHRRQLSDGVWAVWQGRFADGENRTGEAPVGVASCGGVAVLRNGLRFAVLEVYMCLDEDQLGTLATAATRRLG